MVWPLIIGGVAGAGLGYLKNKEDERAYEREQQLNAVKARYSPWTGIHPTNPKEPSMMGSVMSGAMGGAMFGQGLAGAFGGADAAAGATAAAVPGQGPTLQNAALTDGGGPTNAAAAIMDAQPSGKNVFANEFPHGYDMQFDPVAAQAQLHQGPMMGPPTAEDMSGTASFMPRRQTPWHYMY